jgi:ABC-type glycerol-3-phosphate transport system substrate-binding protein
MSPLVHEPATVDALAFYASLLGEAGPKKPATRTCSDARKLYAEGNALFLIDTPRALTEMLNSEPDGTGSRSAIALIPAGPTGRPEPGLRSPAYCIPRASPAKEDGWELLRFLISPAEMLSAAEEAAVESPRESILASDDYGARFGLEFQEVMQRTRAYARINRPLIPHGWDFGDIVGAAVEATIAGDQTADEALRVAQAMIDSMTWTS